jgi:hypothetical protein
MNRCWQSLGRLLLVVICAALAFGGSFECRGSTHDDDFVTNPPPPKPQRGK